MVQTPPVQQQTQPTGLDAHDPGLDAATQQLVGKLNRAGAQDGAQRLELVRLEFQKLTVAEAYQILHPEDMRLELEDTHIRRLNIWHIVRNSVSVAPIVLTWGTLALAAISYQRDLAAYPNDLYQPFLKLWQEGFRGTDPIPFSLAAILDVILLLTLILLIILVPLWENRATWRVQQLLKDLQSVIGRILVVIGKSGSNATLADADIQKITEAIKRTFEHVMLGHDQLARETQDLVKQFRNDLATFNMDLKGLTAQVSGLSSNVHSYDQKLQDFTDASVKLAGSSVDLAQNAKDMASSANQSAQASQGIGGQLKLLNDTQQEIVKTQQQVASTIQQTQKDVVTEINSVADNVEVSNKDVRDASRELERVAQGLEQITRADLQKMTNQVAHAADHVDRVAASLLKLDTQLQQTTQSLATAAQALASVAGITAKKRSLLARLLRRP